jgi:biopolymer transport protein ExbD
MEGQSVPLSAAQRGKIRRLSVPQELSPMDEGGELNIVPYLDIIMNILIFVLATIAVTFTATIDTTPPASQSGGVRSQMETTALNLTVFIVNEGFSLKASGGNIAPGCQSPGAGITIPKKGNQYDYASLTECAARLKKANPDFENETQVYLTANPGTDYQTIVGVIDAVRATPQGDSLFTDVNFKVPR